MGTSEDRIGLVGGTRTDGWAAVRRDRQQGSRFSGQQIDHMWGWRERTRSSPDGHAGIPQLGTPLLETNDSSCALILALETHIGILAAMTIRTGLAVSLLLTCAALACSGGKSDGSNDDGSARLDVSLAAETGPASKDAGGTDAPATDALKLDGIASDGPSQDTPGQVTDAQAPIPDGLDATADLGARPGPDMAWASDGKDAGAADLVDARSSNDVTPKDAAQADAPDAPVVTDGSVDDPEVASAGSPDAALDGPAQCGRIKCDCTYKGKKLWGKVQYVDSFPDFKISVSSFPDLNVNETSFPSRCGEWQRVTAFPDFKVQIVTAFEDFGIAYSSFPGIP